MPTLKHPITRITERMAALQASNRKAFIPYIMAGSPSLVRTKELVRMLVASGADIIELGVPFSDPLADGPVIQRAAEDALSQGVTLKKVLATVDELRKEGIDTPIVLMTYYNPVFKYGEERFMRACAASGVDGLIVPDLPPDEARSYIERARVHNIDTIFLLAPTSTPDRVKLVAKSSTGFIYYVSVTGITGSQLKISPELLMAIAEVKAASKKPVCLGFGVSTPDEANEVAQGADGVIVGSAIVRRAQDPSLEEFLQGLRRAIAS